MQPNHTQELRDQAYRFYQSGDAAAAERLCVQSLTESPDHSEAVYLLGVIAHGKGELEKACKLFDDAEALAPDNAVYTNALGEAQLALGRPLIAMTSFRRAIELRPDYERAHNNLGLVLYARGDLVAAASSFVEALRINPRYATAHNNFGAVLQAQGRHGGAVTHFREAIKERPEYAEAHFNIGSALQARGDNVAAIASFREAIRIRPSYAKAHFHLGEVLSLIRHDHDALASYETAVRLQPDDVEMLGKLGMLLVMKKDWPGAIAALERAAALKPDDPKPFANLFEAKQQTCDWRTYHADLDRLWTDAEDQIAADETTTVLPFHALLLPWEPDRLLAIARSHSEIWVEHNRKQGLSLDTPRRTFRPQRTRLRIGYLSADYCDHPIGHLLHGFFGRHDRDRFEVFAYAFGPSDDSSYRRRIASECEQFVDISHHSNLEIARRIAADGIDILVDLMGHTGINRIGALAFKPAPIQVSFLGMLGTMGASFIDYLITDSVVTPPELAPFFTEQFVTLPFSYLIAEPEPDFQAGEVTRSELGLPEDAFVYCCFNSSFKIEPKTFDLWMRILSQVPYSVLWLYSRGEVVEENLRHEAAARGVDPNRLIFAPFLPRQEHVRRHQAADLFLDTLTYNAAATASLALQLGLPVLTCLGDTFASRVCTSLLTTVGLPELIAPDVATYERIAVGLAGSPQDIRRLRGWLEATKSTSPLFDTPRFVHNLESAYSEMQRIHTAGLSPRPIKVIDDYDQSEGGRHEIESRLSPSSEAHRRPMVICGQS